MKSVAELLPPNDTDAERNVLGAILIDPEAIDKVYGRLRPADFFQEKNGWIYEAMLAVNDRFDPVHQLSVMQELKARDKLDAIGGMPYISHLVAECINSAFAEDFAQLVQARAFERRLISAAGRIAGIAYKGGEASTLLGKAQEEILALSNGANAGGFLGFDQIAMMNEAKTREWMDNPTVPRGTPTKFADLDNIIGGLKPGTFYVLAARPSMGKSQMGLWLCMNVARQGKRAGIFGLEMPKEDILERARLAVARLDHVAIRLGKAPHDWKERYNQARAEVDKLPISVDDTEMITTGTARARVAQLKAKYPDLGIIMFDYGELAGDENQRSEELRVSKISKNLQGMAHALSVPVVGVFQLSRKVEERFDRVPRLADLRYSGMIEQAADVVLMLFRKGYYAKQEPENEKFALAPNEEHLMEVLIEKQRNGPTGRIKVWYEVETGFMQNWESRRGQ